MNAEPNPQLPIFSAYGIEIEYMIVSDQTLDVLPVSDQILRAVSGSYLSEVEMGALGWSNELVLHVIELKTNGPARDLTGLSEHFWHDVRRINEVLEPLHGRLMPTAMHPWMDPLRETRLWPHEYSEVYEAFDRIFGCRGHGWSNLQSVHINLPFANDEEFAKLHTAIRTALPLLPALACSSPIVEGRFDGALDRRLEYYRNNCKKLPEVTGLVVPEACRSRSDYEQRVLAPIARAIDTHDLARLLEPEWTNARGAIARFERGSIEIRVLDVQECPTADLAVVSAVIALVRALAEERWSPLSAQFSLDHAHLAALFSTAARQGGRAVLQDPEYLQALGLSGHRELELRQVWKTLVARLVDDRLVHESAIAPLRHILEHGTLAERIVRGVFGVELSGLRAGDPISSERLHAVYRELCECLAHDRLYQPPRTTEGLSKQAVAGQS